MIAQLKGNVVSLDIHCAIVDINGIGYRVYTTLETLSQLQKESEVLFFTHLAVREMSLDLYGFLDKKGVLFFELLISVSGIGPKSALAIMNLETTATLSSAIAAGDTVYLTKVSGIGKKSAEKIILELRDKVASIEGDPVHTQDKDVLDALQALGYSTKEARETIKELPNDIIGTQKRLTSALKILGKT